MLEKIFFCALLGSLALCSILPAQTNPYGLKVDKRKALFSLIGNERPGEVALAVKPHSGNDTGVRGPGTPVMTSWYDLGSNGGSLTNLVDYGDGTVAFARMGAKLQDKSDRGTFYSYYKNGSFGPVNKVEAQYRGWSNVAALTDGREVVVSHTGAAGGLEVNIDAAKGFGLWTSVLTGSMPGPKILWPRFTINSSNHIIICSTTDGALAGVTNIKQVARSLNNGATWTHQLLRPDTTVRTPRFATDDQAIASLGNKVAIAVAELGGDIHLWESANHGASFSYRNVTKYGATIPKGAQETRPWRACEVIYDKIGNVHIFWEAVLAVADSNGAEQAGIDLFHNRKVGIHHWSAASGIRQAVSWSKIPTASLESDANLFRAGEPFDQINANNTLTAQPQAGIDAAGNLYLMFSAYRPLDFDTDFTHFTDIYVTGSGDGGRTWGQVGNVSNTPRLYEEATRGTRFLITFAVEGKNSVSFQG